MQPQGGEHSCCCRDLLLLLPLGKPSGGCAGQMAEEEPLAWRGGTLEMEEQQDLVSFPVFSQPTEVNANGATFTPGPGL